MTRWHCALKFSKDRCSIVPKKKLRITRVNSIGTFLSTTRTWWLSTIFSSVRRLNNSVGVTFFLPAKPGRGNDNLGLKFEFLRNENKKTVLSLSVTTLGYLILVWSWIRCESYTLNSKSILSITSPWKRIFLFFLLTSISIFRLLGHKSAISKALPTEQKGKIPLECP